MNRRTAGAIIVTVAALAMLAVAALSVDGGVCVDRGLGRTFVACSGL